MERFPNLPIRHKTVNCEAMHLRESRVLAEKKNVQKQASAGEERSSMFVVFVKVRQ
jgi:hypothetical protein